MEYDIVLVTRNRPVILPVSVPLMISQSRPPANFIIVDSSDDHDTVKRIVGKLCVSDKSINFVLLHAEPGTAHQRNVGLKHVNSPVVIFPDDDSLWFPDTAASVMRVYEKDIDDKIGGVCAAESAHPPLGSISRKLYNITLTDGLKRQYHQFVYPLLSRYFPDPLYYFEDILTAPLWLPGENAIVQGPMAGFRMSFRTDLIRSMGFDESLGEYALSEDIDASLGILKKHLIVCAKNARVFHYTFPSRRVDGKEMGMMQMLNRTYIVCKHNESCSPARERLVRFLIFRLFVYFLQAGSKYGREKFYGSLFALRYVNRLRHAKAVDLHKTYWSLRNECAMRLGLKHYSKKAA
ncbi:MAG: glycosyltransferase family A protein [Candidatus Aminicenantales bacterium]